mgnify:CR=1 FL=1
MHINKLSFQNLRGLELIALDPSKSLNFIVGPNNAGKTTILESIYLLSCSKTFRGTHLDKMIQNGKNCFKIVSKISDNNLNDSICIEKSLKSPKISTINNNKVSTKECLCKLPVISLCFGVENLFNFVLILLLTVFDLLMKFQVKDKVKLIAPVSYLKTSDNMPMLRPPDLVAIEEIGEILSIKSLDVVEVKFRRGSFLIDIEKIEKI